MWKAEVFVTLKKGVLDPQGETVRGALQALGYDGVAEVRVGKYMEVFVEGDNAGEVSRQVEEMCQRLLANPVLENFRVRVTAAGAVPAEGAGPGRTAGDRAAAGGGQGQADG